MSAHVTLRGNCDAPTAKTIIFIHGWPDTEALFRNQEQHFGKEYRIGLIGLPGYHKKDAIPFLGYAFDSVVRMVRTAIEGIMVGRTDKPIVVAHDWGAAIANIIAVEAPHLIERLVLLDIGSHVGKLSLRAKLMVAGYQWALIFFFLLPKIAGTPLTKALAWLLGAPSAALPSCHAGMNYLYLQTWWSRLTGTLPKAMTSWSPPTIPVLFLWGEKKPFFFHSKRWLSYLDSTPGSKQLSFPAGHWFFTRPDLIDRNQEMEAFFQSRAKL